MTTPPNILYIHSHDTGRYLEPYGQPVATPNIQLLANQGFLLRNAHSAAPTCSGSRAALMTGEATHSNGMTGLAHRGWSLHDYGHHIVHALREAGYWSVLLGEQHIAQDPSVIGFDEVVDLPSTHATDVAPATVEILDRLPSRPWFLSVGFYETHREFFHPTSIRDVLCSAPPVNLPDVPAVRADIAAFKASAVVLDQGVGAVLGVLDERRLEATTLVVFTTDHGIPFPGSKATLYDRGTNVSWIMRGPPGFTGGRVCDSLISQLDLFPTLCELAGVPEPPWLQGRSMMPIVRGETDEVNDAIFAELTYHAAYEPQRSIRTKRWKYVRRFDDDRHTPVLPNIDDGPSKDVVIDLGWADRELPREALYDTGLDANEAVNLAADPQHTGRLSEMRERLEGWMRDTADPLLDGPMSAPEGALINRRDQRSPEEPLSSRL
jgi:N-sulfoglucosamine sulfohydrolase